MEDIPGNEDTDPRTIYSATGNKPLITVNALLLSIPGSTPDIILIAFLLFFALICSALRASLSASAALETPWNRKNNDKALDRQSRFTLLIIQYICMILSWLLSANLLIRIQQETQVAMYSFVGIVSFWLIIDAIFRWYASRHAQSVSDTLLPVTSVVLDKLSPIGALFLSIGVFLGVAKRDGLGPVASEPDKDESDTIEEKELVLGVAAMGKTTAREAMVSKSNIKAFNIGIDFHELMDLVNKFGYSRIPVYRHNLDSIEGILYIKDLLPYIQQNETFAWQKLIRKAYLIPETKRLDSLLEEFQERRVHMAIVIDEYGSTRGLITLEDIIEEIFGDINDEHDDEDETNFVQLDEKNYVFEGQALLNDVIRTLELESNYFSELRSHSETLAGLVIDLFTRFPRHGEEVDFRGLTFRIQSSNKKQIKKVRVILPG